MSVSSQLIINENIDFLKKDLEGDVLVACEKILNVEEIKKLNEKESEAEKIEFFLECLTRKPFQDLSLFLNYLNIWYEWLYTRLLETISRLKNDNPLLKVHTLGGIPNLPSKNVLRTDLMRQVENELKNLQTGEYLVLHGMVGSGKTSLAVQALNNYSIIKNSFQDQVYWLTVGHEGANDPTKLLTELNQRLPDPLPSLSNLTKLATIELAKRFVEKKWCNCLIILDDVTDESVLDVFDLGTKVLITTKDRTVISERRAEKAKVIKVSEGFTPEETVTFFAKSLEVPVNELPPYISEIHKSTKGHPFTLSLIASLFIDDYREDLIKNNARWEYIINMVLAKGNRRWFRRKTLTFNMCGLNTRKRKVRRSLSDLDLFIKPIEHSVNSLTPDEQTCFYKLAVFMEDVNIKPEVLSVLWSVNKYEAEGIMVGFVRKSLAVRSWNELQNSFVYGVHDLIADFLRRHLSQDQEEEFHKSFILGYQKISGNDWSALPPKDNYIFYYIGHHLKKAGMKEQFQSIYFNLDFLQAKLKVTGPADLIRDFKKYRDLIANGDKILIEKLEDYSKFIEDFGVWIVQGVDIIQAGLQTPPDTHVHHAARELALSAPYPLPYIQCFLPKKKIPESLALKDNPGIVSVCFGRSLYETIIALDNFAIELYNFKTKSFTRRFIGPTKKITCLSLSPCKTQFLASSLDKTVQVWVISNSEASGDRTPSPRDRQGDYVDFFNIDMKGERPKCVFRHSHEVVSALYSKHGDVIASLCSNGLVTLWKDEKKSWSWDRENVISIDFMKDGNIVAANAAKIFLLSSGHGGSVLKTLDHDFDDLISLRALPIGIGDLVEGIVMIGKRRMTLFMNQASTPLDMPMHSLYTKSCSIGPYIAVTTEDKSLFVFNPENGTIIAHLQSQQKVVDFCVGESAILAGDKDGKVLLYPLEALSSPFTRVKWVSGSEPVLASVDNTRTIINVIVGENTSSKMTGDVERMDVSEDGGAVVTSSKTGKVVFYNFVECEEVEIIKTPNVPSGLFLLRSPEEHIILLSYCTNETFMWRSKTKSLKQLWGSQIGIEFAELVNFTSKQLIITAKPFKMWSMEGQKLCELKLDGAYCISKESQLLAVSSKIGLMVYSFSEDGSIKEKDPPLKESSRHIQLIAYSPSGTTLAYTDSEGIIKINECYRQTELTYLTNNDFVNKSTSLAVSDNGTVCLGGDGLLSIVTRSGMITTAVLDPAFIAADPSGQDLFAVADKTGTMFKISQNVVKDHNTSDPSEIVIDRNED